jgi:hypothetical protein
MHRFLPLHSPLICICAATTTKMEQMRHACYIAPEELYRSKEMKVAPKTSLPEHQTTASSPKSSLPSPNGKRTSSKSDSAAASPCVQAWEELVTRHRHHLADSASEFSVNGDPVLHDAFAGVFVNLRCRRCRRHR